MICCPFHADRNPSMKVIFRFHCFAVERMVMFIDFAANCFNCPCCKRLKSWLQILGFLQQAILHDSSTEKTKSERATLQNLVQLSFLWQIGHGLGLKIRFCRKSTLCRPCAISADILLQGSPNEKATTTQRKGSDRSWKSNRTMQRTRRKHSAPARNWVGDNGKIIEPLFADYFLKPCAVFKANGGWHDGRMKPH